MDGLPKCIRGDRHIHVLDATETSSYPCCPSLSFVRENNAYIARSYAIFNPPARKKGKATAAACIAIPEKMGAIAAAAGRTAFVKPAARARSSGRTAYIVKA